MANKKNRTKRQASYQATIPNPKSKTKPPSQTIKKGLSSKKAEIDKLIVQSKRELLGGTSQPPAKFHIRLPPARPSSSVGTPLKNSTTKILHHLSHQVSPKKVQPGLPQERMYKILDLRHYSPDLPLIRLPCEPDVPRALRGFQPRGTFPFLDLPGELRNKIYDYAIATNHYAMEWVCDNKKSKSLTYRLPKISSTSGPWLKLTADAALRRRALHPIGGRVRQRLPDDYFRTTPVALLLVCKQMHEEASSVFYSKNTFDFHGIGALNHFLNYLQPTAKMSITKLIIRYRAYGYPEYIPNQYCKDMHDRSWEKLCWRVADECTSLNKIRLDLTLNKSPVSFCAFDDVEDSGLGAQWIRPLRAFQYIGIERCWARVHCSVKDRSVLEWASWNIRKEIIGDLWDQEAENERDPFGREKLNKEPREVRKGRVLRITADGGVEED